MSSSAPDPAVVRTPQEFVQQLRELKAHCGEPSLRELQRRSGLPRSTLADTFDPRRTRLPPLDRITTIVAALGLPAEEVDAWSAAWRSLQGRLVQRTEPEPVAPLAPELAPEPRRRWWRQLAVVGVLLLLAAVQASDGPLPGPAAAAAASAQRGPWRARVAEEALAQDGTSETLPVAHPARGGDALVLTLMLTSTTPGPVTVTDSQGNRYRIVGDVTDARHHRTLIAAAFAVRPLMVGDALTVVHPAASKHHLALDEYGGLTKAGPSATAHGEQHGTVFGTGSTPLDAAPGELLIAAVGTNSGTTPVFAPGWRTLPTVKLSSYQLSVAYRVVAAPGAYTVSGATNAQWGAVLVSFG
ncbi:hypothetical protein [Kitasatospora sp. McL0602]|uniref:hypothetical protein n=1 Tax=Kitasatospora sp. McL0602 TaxID=3439530 RepID=UPI003F88E8C3